jgi:hypothetical protein
VSQNHDVESQLKFDTVGLVRLDEYRSIREKLEKKRAQDEANKGKEIECVVFYYYRRFCAPNCFKLLLPSCVLSHTQTGIYSRRKYINHFSVA